MKLPAFTAALGLCLGLAGPALAKPVTWLCRLDVPRSQAWVPDQLVIQLEPGADTGLVNDPIIRHFVGQPLPARVETDNARRITLRWKLDMVRNASGQVAPQFIYRATVQKGTLDIRVTAIPAGYSNVFEAGGKCAPQ